MMLQETNESDGLIAERILANKWDEPLGAFIYDISYLHPDWGTVTQTYDGYTTNYNAERIYDSEFLLYRPGEPDLPSDFSGYDKDLKGQLWQVVFAIKRRFIAEYQPAEIRHLIKPPSTVAQRFPIYERNLILPNYLLTRDRTVIRYTRID